MSLRSVYPVMSAAPKAPDPAARRPAAWAESVAGRWRGLVVAATMLSLFLAPAGAADEDEPEKPSPLSKDMAELARKYAAVAEWQGFFEYSESQSVVIHGYYNQGAKTVEKTSHGHFLLKRSPIYWLGDYLRRGVLTWSGGDNHTICGEQTSSSDEQYSKWDKNGLGSEWRIHGGGTQQMTATEFAIWLPKTTKKGHLVSIHPGSILDGKPLTYTKTGRSVREEGDGNGNIIRRTKSLDETWPASGFVHWLSPVGEAAGAPWLQVVLAGPGVLVFPFEDKKQSASQSETEEQTRRSRVILFPVYDDLEVEVTINGYAKWRPEGSIKDPKKPGNSIGARATLKSKTGKLKDLPAVRRFKFELLETSREPGVCLNWPLGAKDEDFDLRLAAGGGKLSAADQKLSVADQAKDDKGQPYAEATIDSYDFGGRTTLQVLCELEDGREIMGLMKAEGGEEDLVRLPKRAGPDWIAESWRKEKKAEKLAANDDDEKVEGQKDNGDGFTLYEEYRGWAENGKHIEGDPERKDFFVLNMIGFDARPGIELFETISKLRVHSKLRRWEMSQDDRLMNGNRRDAPHRKEGQHGVWVKTYTRSDLGDNGAATRMAKGGVAGRPGTTLRIGILARGNSESIFNQPFNLPAQDAIFAYDRAIAHELLHSVGVEHHGPSDTTGYALKFIPPNVPANKIGRPHYQSGNGTTFTLLLENGQDLAALVNVQYEEVMVKLRPMMMDMLMMLWSKGPAGARAPAEARMLAEASMSGAFDQIYEQKGQVGLESAEHSGNQDCVMRYYFARFYKAKDGVNTLYIVAPGTERIGMEICRSAKGTGNNAPKPPNLPQSRYGDAKEGDCFSQICPNDAIPPRTVK